MDILLNANDIRTVLTSNMQDWKRNADIENVQELNATLVDTDILHILVSPTFYDDINDLEQDLMSVLDKHYLPYHPHIKRESYILIHDIYNR